MNLLLNNIPVRFSLDTGADVTILKYENYCELNLPLIPSSKFLVSADGTPLNCAGEVANAVLATKRGMRLKASVFVLKGAARNLLSLDHAMSLDLLVLVNEVSKEKFDPIKIFPKLFEGLGKMPEVFIIDLVPDAKPYRLYSPRPIPAGLKDKAKAKIDEMLALSVIEPVEQPTDWCFGLTIAPKANGDIRMCVDLTHLNKSVRREIYPLPRVSDMLAMLSEGKIFSKIDAKSGFWQIKLDPKSKLLTTFITPWGRFCYRVMPFGISSAPEVFQRSMEKILRGLEGVVCLMDDVLVFAADCDTHWKRLHAVLCRLQEAGVTLNKQKCEFGCKSVKFLGHLVSYKGVQPDPDKVQAIVKLNPPKCQRDAKRFMGMVNYLSKFSGKLAELSVPIYAVMGKSDWFWSDIQERAFNLIKLEITNFPVLCAFDLNCDHRVSADASRSALGAVLLQCNPVKEWQPVEYASRKLTDAESRYAMIELESLAVTWACEKFDFYLVGRKFEIETDHKPLVSLLGNKDLSQLPLRVQRFKLRLMRYGYSIFHTPGKHMHIADALSRPVDSDYSDVGDECKLECAAVESYVAAAISDLCNDVREDELISVTRCDPVSMECIDFIVNGWPLSGKSLRGELLKLYANRDRLTVYGDIIMFDSRLYIPYNLRDKYLQFCHEGHQGIDKCRRRARQLFWWPGLSTDVEDFVKKCNVCIRNSAIKHEPCIFTPLPEGPWVEIGSDIMVFEHQLYLIIADYYTKWIECIAIPTQTAKVVVSVMKEVFSRLGVPKVVRSDNGSCYDSREFREFADLWGFKCVTSSPRYAPSNGMAEKAVDIVKRLWRKCTDKEAALLAYRTTPLASGFTPSELMFGRATRSKMGSPRDSSVDYKLFEQIESENIEKRSAKWDLKYRAKQLPELKPGDRVWVKAPSDLGSEGVVDRLDHNPNSYWVMVGAKVVRRNRKHLFLLCGDSLDASDDDCMPFELVDEPKVQKLPRLAASRDSQSLSTSSPIGNNIPLKQPVVGGHNTSLEQPVLVDQQASLEHHAVSDNVESDQVQSSDPARPESTNLLSEGGSDGLGLTELYTDARPKTSAPVYEDAGVSKFGRKRRTVRDPEFEYS